jgi:hypothetical protein
MVENRDSQGPPRLPELPRDRPIFSGGGGIARRMVVHENHPRRTFTHRHAEDLSRVNERGIENPPRDQHLAYDAVTGVEQEGVKLLLSHILKSGAHASKDIGRASDGSFGRGLFDGGAASEFERSHEPGSRRDPYTRDILERSYVRAGQTREHGKAMAQSRSDRACRAPDRTTAHDECQEFFRREVTCTYCP